MEQFIREKIKDKPLNKKRLAKKAGTAALCGVAFAVAASIVFAIFLPVINRQSKKASDGKNNNDVQTATQQSGIDDSTTAGSLKTKMMSAYMRPMLTVQRATFSSRRSTLEEIASIFGLSRG